MLNINFLDFKKIIKKRKIKLFITQLIPQVSMK